MKRVTCRIYQDAFGWYPVLPCCPSCPDVGLLSRNWSAGAKCSRCGEEFAVRVPDYPKGIGHKFGCEA